nr:CotH kinase family protein [Bacteroidales bacterium]
MRHFRKIAFCLALLMAWTACEKEQQQPEEPKPVLTYVQVGSTLVEIPEKGTAEVLFSVKEADFSFDLQRDVTIYPSSEAFTLQEVRPAGEFLYVAVLADKGGEDDYEQAVRLGVREKAGEEVFVFSSVFTVRLKRADPGVLIPETGLPTVFVNTEDGAPIVSKTDYLTATLGIRSVGGDYELEDVTCQVRGRGNTTWGWPKKPYLIKLDKKESVLGMPKHKRWILLANFMDRTLMRNLVSMKVSS